MVAAAWVRGSIRPARGGRPATKTDSPFHTDAAHSPSNSPNIWLTFRRCVLENSPLLASQRIRAKPTKRNSHASDGVQHAPCSARPAFGPGRLVISCLILPTASGEIFGQTCLGKRDFLIINSRNVRRPCQPQLMNASQKIDSSAPTTAYP